MQPHHLIKKRSSLGGGKLQIGGAQLQELTPGPQMSQGKGGIDSTDDDPMYLRWQIVEQKGERAMNDFNFNHMVIVKDKNEFSWAGRDLIHQSGERSFEWERLGRMEYTQAGFTQVVPNCLQGGDDIGQEVHGIIISPI